MIVSVRPVILGVSLAVLVFTVPFQAAAQTTTPASPPQGTQAPNSDYGPGGHAVVQNDTSGAELQGTVYDPSGTLRHDETNTYTTTGGAEHKTEQHDHDYDFKGHLQLGLDYKYDLRGGLSYSDITHYGLHGERTAEEVTNYRADGYEIKDWSLGTHGWYSNTIAYKTPLAASTPAQTPLAPTNTNVGVLFPRSYLPGETITGSLWPSTYAENFKVVPGLTESSFPIQLYNLPDGTPEWLSLDIGVKGDGYIPVNPNGTFSLHIPYDWKGPLQLQARQPNPVAGAGPTDAQLNLDPPAAAPALTDEQFPSSALERLGFYSEGHLVDLWNDACDDEELLDELYDEPNPDWERINEIEDRLDDTYDDIDEIEDDMPPQEVTTLAQQMLEEANDFHNWLSKQPNLTADEKADLEDSSYWAGFLDNEIGYNNFLASWGPAKVTLQPYFTNPVLTRGHLAEIGGGFSLDPYDTHIGIDNIPITPLAATPYTWYFMPPAGLTAGQHNYIIDSPLYPETILPVFNMTMTESIVTNKMLTGQSTSYRFTLDGMNGVPGGAWSGSYYPTDLVGSSELSAAQQAAGNARTGYITFSVTNETPDVISMQNQFKILNASSFAPSGSATIEGGIGALTKGNFLINGVARAYLDPEVGIGTPPGTTPPGGSTGPLPGTMGTNWFPPFSVNYDMAAFSNSSFMTSCPNSGAAPTATTPTATGGHPASTTCVDSVINDLMPAKNVSDNTPAKGNPPSTVPIGDNTNTPDLDAARQRRQSAISKEENAYDKLDDAERKEHDAFRSALNNLSVDDQNDYARALKQFTDTFRKKIEADSVKNPTAEDIRRAQIEKEQLAIDQDFLRIAKEDAVDKFKPEDRQAWQATRDALEKAQRDFNDAQNERRAADEALQKLQAATAN